MKTQKWFERQRNAQGTSCMYVLKHPDLCLDGAVKETDIINMFFLKFLNADCSSLSYDGYWYPPQHTLEYRLLLLLLLEGSICRYWIEYGWYCVDVATNNRKMANSFLGEALKNILFVKCQMPHFTSIL